MASSEVEFACSAIRELSAVARESRLARVSVNLPIIGAVDITLSYDTPPPALAAVPTHRGTPGPASRLAAFHAKSAEARHNTLFAASSVKPKFMPAEPPRSTVPRAVRERSEARGEDQAEK